MPASPANSLPVDIYVRVSRIGGREHLQSPAEQERDARREAARHGLQVGEVITDLDKSGGTLDRPGLREVLARVESGQSGGVVVAYLSRLSRDTAQGLDLLARVREAGGEVYAPNLPADWGTADGRMLTTFQLAVDAGYRERKGEELERAKASAVERGVPIVTRPAVGYRLRDDRTLEPDPAAAPVVREVFERRAVGAGPAELGDLLWLRGVTTSQGSRTWSRQAIYGLLRNRVYRGEVSYGKDGRYVNPKAHEPIVDLATWTAAQGAAGSPRLSATAGAYLLAGILRCGGCGYAMQGTTTSRGKRIYRCTRRHASGICPAPARLDAQVADDLATEAYWALVGDLEAQGTPEVSGSDVGALEAQLERAEARLAQAQTPDAQDALGESWLTVVRERREARDTAAGDLGRARASAPAPTVRVVSLRGTWQEASTAERRDLLGSSLDALVARKGSADLEAYPTGTAPSDLPRRGYRRKPVMRPIPKAA